MNISANSSTLSIRSAITAQCVRSEVLRLKPSQGSSSSFCVIWESLLDHLVVSLNGENLTLCNATGLQAQCCTHLSPGPQNNSQQYGIKDGKVKGDELSRSVMAEYQFIGESIDCSKFTVYIQ